MSAEPYSPILEALRALGVVAWRNQAGRVKVRGGWMHLAPDGTPDLIGYLPDGRLLGLEVKVPGKRPSPAQEVWLREAEKAGCVVGTVTHPQEALDLIRRQRL